MDRKERKVYPVLKCSFSSSKADALIRAEGLKPIFPSFVTA